MMETFDVEGLALGWLRGLPIVGRDKPVVGAHLSDTVRSPHSGAICEVSVTGSPTVDIEGFGHQARVSFLLKASGGEDGAKRQGERAARAVAQACRTRMAGSTEVVTIRAGQADEQTARLAYTAQVFGPTPAGTIGGESRYRVDATFLWQGV